MVRVRVRNIFECIAAAMLEDEFGARFKIQVRFVLRYYGQSTGNRYPRSRRVGCREAET